jgi:hypothetical protein
MNHEWRTIIGGRTITVVDIPPRENTDEEHSRTGAGALYDGAGGLHGHPGSDKSRNCIAG